MPKPPRVKGGARRRYNNRSVPKATAPARSPAARAFWMGPLSWAQLVILPVGLAAFVAGGALLGGMATRPRWQRATWLGGLVGLSWILVLTWSVGRRSVVFVSPMTMAAERLNEGAGLIQGFTMLTVFGSWLVALAFRPAKRLQYVTAFAGWDLRGNWSKDWDNLWNRVPSPGWEGNWELDLRMWGGPAPGLLPRTGLWLVVVHFVALAPAVALSLFLWPA